MSNITRFDPFNELARIDPVLDMNDFFKRFGLRSMMRDWEYEPHMKVDVSEADGAYTVKADIPGVKKDDIHISVDGNMVSISAELKKEKEEKKGESVLRSERYFGKVSRSFSLASEIDQDKIQAKYSDGVLEVTLPKKAGKTAKKITVT